jgi:hypothetical protein
MSDKENKGFSFSVEAERTTQQAILYWTIIFCITIPVLFVVTGIIVRWALGLAA